MIKTHISEYLTWKTDTFVYVELKHFSKHEWARWHLCKITGVDVLLHSWTLSVLTTKPQTEICDWHCRKRPPSELKTPYALQIRACQPPQSPPPQTHIRIHKWDNNIEIRLRKVKNVSPKGVFLTPVNGWHLPNDYLTCFSSVFWCQWHDEIEPRPQ